MMVFLLEAASLGLGLRLSSSETVNKSSHDEIRAAVHCASEAPA